MESQFGITEFLLGHQLAPIRNQYLSKSTDLYIQEVNENGEEVIPARNAVIRAPPEIGGINQNIQKLNFMSDINLLELDRHFTNGGKRVVMKVNPNDWKKRRELKGFLEQRYNGSMVSKQQGRSIVVSHISMLKERPTWDEGTPVFCHFTLAKENMDMQEALATIAKALGYIEVTDFTFNEDKGHRAVSSQRVCVRHVLERTLLQINNGMSKIKVFNVEYKNEAIQPFSNKGNQFTVILRNIAEESINELAERFKGLESTGFINYIGTHAIGMKCHIASEAGLAILKKNFERAVKLILLFCQKDVWSPALQLFFTTGDARQAAAALTAVDTLNAGRFLTTLKDGGTFQACIDKLPRAEAEKFVHAYQFHLWNKLATERMREGGYRVLGYDLGADGQPLELCAPVFDIHLPMPGCQTEQSEDTYSGRHILRLLAADGITLSDFQSLERLKYSTRPRPLFMRMFNFSSCVIEYSENDILQAGVRTGRNNYSGSLRALKMSFFLPPDAYVSAALREATSTDMSQRAHVDASKPQTADDFMHSEHKRHELEILCR
ncbi:unnamed protein product [Caenorhabditis sp. 36 PRJEB53466]|nr:unnamed protein product [Caenorhabditis sp. 36 PRJEB53466]